MEPSATETLLECPLCGGTALLKSLEVIDHSVSKERFQLVGCATCGFCFTNPRPTPTAIGMYYESEAYISHTNASKSLIDRLYQFARKRALRSKHALIRRYHPRGGVLDIGCGTGEFLGYLKAHGYGVQGVEPSSKARALAVSNHGLSVAGAVGEVLAATPFDAITLWHVLEHLYDLHGTFVRLRELLLPGGHLFIAVPDRGSWDREHYGATWAAWDVPRHLSHFRQEDVQKLLSTHHFQLVATKRMLMDAPYVSILSERYRGRSPVGSLARGLLNGAWSNTVSLVSGRASSSTLFIAKKR